MHACIFAQSRNEDNMHAFEFGMRGLDVECMHAAILACFTHAI